MTRTSNSKKYKRIKKENNLHQILKIEDVNIVVELSDKEEKEWENTYQLQYSISYD